MINFLEKFVAMLIAFCMGCYTTAVFLDNAFVEKQKLKIKEYIQNFIFNTDANL